MWQRYRDVAELGDQHEVYLRLKEFLDSFRAQYEEISTFGDNSENLDRLYGDCTEVLHSLLDYVDRELKLPGSDGAEAEASSAEPPVSSLPRRLFSRVFCNSVSVVTFEGVSGKHGPKMPPTWVPRRVQNRQKIGKKEIIF